MLSTDLYLEQLQTDKQNLVDNLVTKGVSATSDETFTSLVPKVLDIESGSDVEITDASYLFYKGARISSLTGLLDICKNVTTCQSMFQNARTVASIDLSNFDTSNVTDMTNMFQGCNNLTSLNLSNFDTSNVITMMYMFSDCMQLTELIVSNFNTSNTINMLRMFYMCSSLTELDLSSFDTSKVINMALMFYHCDGLTELDLSSFDTNTVANNSNMFQYCTNLTKLIINRQDVFKMTSTNMFQSTPIASGTGYVYVPDNMVATYKSATNWSTYADQIKGMSELPTEEA